ncbi:MAG: hypothetical protein EOP34_02000 [Rickettsiales bacterium]|nr:MAG: hypothetical protein EOP34_02000 [Rickettsiales bacterium]
MYAYSTISHVGFILLALSVDRTESIQAYIFYIISYTISNLNAFVILVTIGYTMYLYLPQGEKAKVMEKEASKVLNFTMPGHNAETANTDLDTANTDLDPALKGLVSEEREKLFHEIRKISIDLDNNKYTSYSKTFQDLGLKDLEYSPIQLVSQLKGYFYINPYLALSLSVSLFSFIGIPPLVGFFAKQMVLSAALDNGYIFITLVAILTSVIGAAYYLNIVKQMFFFQSDYVLNPFLTRFNYFGSVVGLNNKALTLKDKYTLYNVHNIKISSALSIVISVMTLLLLLFIFIPNESFNLAKILTLLIFN